MKKAELKEYRDMKLELKHLKELINNVFNVKVTQFGNISRTSEINNPTENAFFKKQKLEKKYKLIEEKLIEKLTDIEEFISNIPEAITREIFRRRYIEGENWVKISMNVGISRRHCIRKHNYYLNHKL